MPSRLQPEGHRAVGGGVAEATPSGGAVGVRLSRRAWGLGEAKNPEPAADRQLVVHDWLRTVSPLCPVRLAAVNCRCHPQLRQPPAWQTLPRPLLRSGPG